MANGRLVFVMSVYIWIQCCLLTHFSAASMSSLLANITATISKAIQLDLNASTSGTETIFVKQSHEVYQSVFDRRSLIVTSIDYKPFAIKYLNGSWGGIAFDVLNELTLMYNFSYTVKEPPDGAWGVDIGNGTFNGMIGMIQRGEADVGVNAFTITRGRHEVIDFTVPIFYDDYLLLMKKPMATGSEYFTRPFSANVWLAAGIALPVTALISSVYYALNMKIRVRSSNFVWWKEVFRHFPRFLWKHFQCSVGQALTVLPGPTAVRLVFVWWWMLCLILGAAYTGNLTASLAVRKIRLPISDIKTLAASKVTLNVLANSAPVDFMRMSNNPLLREIYRKKIKPRENDMPRSITEQFQEVLNNPNSIALLPYKSFNYIHYQPPPFNKLKCAFSVSKINIYWNLGAFPVKKNSLYGQKLSIGILRMHEIGVIKRITDQYIGPSGCTGYERTEQLTQFNISSLYGVILVLAYGLTLSTIVLLVEMIVTQRRNFPKRTKSTSKGFLLNLHPFCSAQSDLYNISLWNFQSIH